MPRTKLDDLPAELIVRIASDTSPETVLTLCQVSRVLRASCYDSLVFLGAFDDRAWAKHYLHKHIQDVDLIARYAVAESRHLQLNEQNPSIGQPKVNPTTAELLRYLPNLAILGNRASKDDHAFVLGRRVSLLGGVPGERELGYELAELKDKRALISFMFACGLMRDAPSMPSRSTTLEEASHSCVITYHTYEALAWGIRNEAPGYIQRFHADCMLGVGKFATLLACSWPDDAHNPSLPPSTLLPDSPWRVRSPHISKMPLARSVLELPRPFLPERQSVEAWNTWMRQTREERSTPAYLDSGEWYGVYSYNNAWDHTLDTSFDPPMQDIHFQTRVAVPETGDMSIEGSGRDRIGDFRVTLRMDRDGYIQGRKAYRHQPTTWAWHLSNTPFGLYGLWSQGIEGGNVGRIGGVVWLWKKEWIP